MDNYGIFLRKMIKIVAIGDTIIINYPFSIVHYLSVFYHSFAILTTETYRGIL